MPVSTSTESGRRVSGLIAARILGAVAIGLAIVIAAGSLVALATGSRSRKLAREFAAAFEDPAAARSREVFAGVGRLRAKTADGKAVVVATIAFPYDGADLAFKEELSRKAPALRAAAAAWFSARRADELSPAFEGAVKAALRDVMNGLLSLGRIEGIWLSDFSVIE
jgi:flagellar basal body-associated protein FliL